MECMVKQIHGVFIMWPAKEVPGLERSEGAVVSIETRSGVKAMRRPGQWANGHSFLMNRDRRLTGIGRGLGSDSRPFIAHKPPPPTTE